MPFNGPQNLLQQCCMKFSLLNTLSGNRALHTVPNWSILSNKKYNPGQPIEKPGFWLSNRPFCIRTTFIWVHQGTSNSSDFFSIIGYYIEFSNMESKPNFAKVHGPWWTQIKVVLIQKGLLDNQNPDFCMGWPGLYLLDNIDQLGSVCWLTLLLCSGD